MVNERRVGAHRYRRRGGVANNVVRGIALAYRNRGAITSAGRNARAAVDKIVKGVRNMRMTGVKRRRVGPNARGKSGSSRNGNSVDTGCGAELHKSQHVVKLGSNRNMMGKLINANIQSIYFRWNTMSPFMNTTEPTKNPPGMLGGGAYGLYNYINSLGSQGAVSQTPLHLFDLTSVPNLVEGSLVAPNVAYELAFVQASAGAAYPSVDLRMSNVNVHCRSNLL
ncbi:hypothetical protein CEUSTIGMA_g13966.t1 [Chlamydomonas eustigma]|uniref:Uncharacterized protein n=1 Tax=Chlamydomonas eustigma TaxID=1157962 RepID=A0A250XUB4_9CHLO|nr:hypothetical protein CEUSTIGMA_g13966.t1 [Chlamydomonas eustigma]|eukprot:GAX86559.1 hypothetical protein CEUSTIGMA_g13966.t1 [Chlamydomonas eustigma]